MKMNRKSKVFAFCIILTIIFFLPLIPTVRGEIDVKKAIIGKWERYDPKHKGKETMEFFKDGIVSLFHESFGFPGTGDYKFTDNNHIKVNLGGLWTLVGPIICKISVSVNKLTLTFPDGDLAEYNKVSSKIIHPPKETAGGSQKKEKQISKEDLIKSFLMPLEEGAYEKAQRFKGTVYKGLFHLGEDYCVKKAGEIKDGSLYGTPLYPIRDGTVVDLRFNKYPGKDREKWNKGDGVGNYVTIDQGNGIIAVYMHLAKVEVIKGQQVSAQTPIGEAGDIILHPEVPGKMCPHLHLEIRKNGVTSLHVPPNLRYGYISQDGATKIEEGKGIENVLEWIDSNFYDPDSILTPRKAHLRMKAEPQITSSLKITPQKEKYQVGDVLSAEFNIANKGNSSITFDVLTVGGRVNDICPNGKCPDFEWKRDISLKLNVTYLYRGKIKLETAGDYHFFTACKTKDGWNTAIPTAPGIINTIDIKVETGPSPPITQTPTSQAPVLTIPTSPTSKTEYAGSTPAVIAQDDPVSKLLVALRKGNPPPELFIEAFRFLYKIVKYDQITNTEVRNLLIKKGGTNFVKDIAINALIEILIEEIPDGLLKKLHIDDKYVFKLIIITAKNAATLNYKSQIIDSAFLIARSLEETISVIKQLPTKESLPPREYEKVKYLYTAKKLIEQIEVSPILEISSSSGGTSVSAGINLISVGTSIYIMGTGFTRNSEAVIYERTVYEKSSKENVRGNLKTDSYGQFSKWVMVDTPGNKFLWAVDIITEKKTKEIFYTALGSTKPTTELTVSAYPILSISPPSGTVGMTFTQTGKGFSQNKTATLYERKPDRSERQIATVTTDSTGSFSRAWKAEAPGNNLTYWAIDNSTNKKSNEVVYSVTAVTTPTSPPGDKPPNVTSFSTSTSQINQGQSVSLSYSVADDLGLKQVELWRADDSVGIGFREIKKVSVSGMSYSGSFSDTPTSAGTYRYGVHVVDNSEKWNDERNSQTSFSPGIYGPRQVVVKGIPVTPPAPTPTITSPGTGAEPGQMITTLTPTLQWNPVSGSDYYALAISKDPYGSSNIVYNPQRIYGTSQTVPSGVLEYRQQYRWNIQAFISGRLSPVSNILYFYTSTAVSSTIINPQIVSISPTQVQAGQFTLTINGNNFDSGAVDQFYTPSGQYMGSGAQSGGLISRNSNQIVVRENLTGALAGTYGVRVKTSDGKVSNQVNIVVTAVPTPTISPNVSMFPSSGSVGTTFTQTGRGFTPNATATLYGRRPEGGVWQINIARTDSSGAFSLTWTAQTPGSNFAWWAVDNPTSIKSNEIVYNVVSVAPPLPPTQIISTRIDGYSPADPNNPVRIKVGGSASINVRITNTGNTAWRFIAGVSVWDSAGRIVGDYSSALSLPLQPGQQTSMSWSHPIRSAGEYWVQFGVWKQTPFVAGNLLEKRPIPAQRVIIGSK